MKTAYKIFENLPKEAISIRTSVFIKEQGFKNEFDDIDAKAHHLIFYADDIPVGCARFFTEDNQSENYILGRLAVLKSHRKLNLGTKIMVTFQETIKKLGGKKISLSAQCQAKNFYEKLGFVASGEIYLDETCPHIHMEKLL